MPNVAIAGSNCYHFGFLNTQIMNLLHFIFSLIKPERKVTWLSIAFSRWDSKRRKTNNYNYKKYNKIPSLYFEVPGAGDICISESCHHYTGKVVGFSFGVEWGNHGYAGGVIGRDEAIRMANFIIAKCSKITETMDEERERIKIDRNYFYNQSCSQAE